MTPDYNNAAIFYDRLSRVLFGSALIDAQVFLLKYIPTGARVIIVGGGTGWILEELSKLHPAGLNITYVEMAEKMIIRSKRRFTGSNNIEFVNDDVKNLKTEIPFDVVITPFLFDNFSHQNASELFDHIHKLICPGGLWLYCDFQLTGKWWQKVLLKTMLVFFRVISRIEATELPNVKSLFLIHKYVPVEQKTFFKDFVISVVYLSPINNSQ